MSEGAVTQYDLICVGSGIGGCAAAAAAASAGASVLILEKTDQVGGVTTYSLGQFWLPATRLSKELGIEDSIEDGIEYISALAGEWGDRELTVNLLSKANEALEYFEDQHGLSLRVDPTLPDYYYGRVPHGSLSGRYLEPNPIDPRTLGDWQDKLRLCPTQLIDAGPDPDEGERSRGDAHIDGGEALAAYFLRAAINSGAEIWTESRVVGLQTEQGRVVGVQIDGPKGQRSVAARRGVVLATGGYDWNPELVSRFEGALDPASSASPPGIDGDHLSLATRLGAAITALPPSRNVMFLGYATDEADVDGHQRHLPHFPAVASPHEIIVNRAGERFADEWFYPSLATAIQTFDGDRHTYPNWPAWHIFDETNMQSRQRLGLRMPPADAMVSADSLEELASLVGIKPSGLVGSVGRFNGSCDRGSDPDFGRGEVAWSRAVAGLGSTSEPSGAALGRIEKAPYYAAALSRVQLGVPSAGLEINENAQAVTLTGDPIPGLYAVGNASGRNDLGVCLQSGIPNTRGMVYGYLAARHAMRV